MYFVITYSLPYRNHLKSDLIKENRMKLQFQILQLKVFGTIGVGPKIIIHRFMQQLKLLYCNSIQSKCNIKVGIHVFAIDYNFAVFV